MHELAIAAYLLDAVETHAREMGASRVLAINLLVGERSGIVADSLRFSFDLLAPGTVADGAALNLRHTTMRFACADCGEDYQPSGADFACPRCHTVGQVTDDGSTLLIESLAIET